MLIFRGKCPPKGITKESELTRNDEARKPHPVKQSIMLPLDCEDLLKNPKIKTIDLRPAVTVHTSMVRSTAIWGKCVVQALGRLKRERDLKSSL
jgi:hypothetical protein